MQNNLTRTAILRASFILVVIESGAAYLYCTVNNPEITLFIVALAVAGVLSAIGIFNFVRAPQSTRLKRLPQILLMGVIVGILQCCASIIILVIGALQGSMDWMNVCNIPFGIYIAGVFWSRRQKLLKTGREEN